MSDLVIGPNPGFNAFPFTFGRQLSSDNAIYPPIPNVFGAQLFWRVRRLQAAFTISSGSITITGPVDAGLLDVVTGWTPSGGVAQPWNTSGYYPLISSPISTVMPSVSTEHVLLQGSTLGGLSSESQWCGYDPYHQGVKSVTLSPTLDRNSFYYLSDSEVLLRSSIFSFQLSKQLNASSSTPAGVSLTVSAIENPNSDSGTVLVYTGHYSRSVVTDLGTCGTLTLLGKEIPLYATLRWGVQYATDTSDIWFTGTPVTGGSCSCNATVTGIDWWPYKNSNGDPVWDTTTGENLAPVV